MQYKPRYQTQCVLGQRLAEIPGPDSHEGCSTLNEGSCVGRLQIDLSDQIPLTARLQSNTPIRVNGLDTPLIAL